MNAQPLAPELFERLHWVNAPAPSLRQMRGRVVLLVFWSSGSVYCHNLLEELRQVQGKHAESVSLIGIHTPKFDAERNDARLLKAINRLGIRFPVANDPGFVTWQHYGVRAWPSVAVIDPRGILIEISAGDLRREPIDTLVDRLLEEAGRLDTRVFDVMAAVVKPEPRAALSFPSGLAVTQQHLYVVDTGHHRVLECSHEGRILRQFGSGNPGFLDGGSAECSFQSPRGIALTKDALYVADTGNHAIRRVRLLDGDVDTLAGTGRPGDPSGPQQGNAAALVLNAPWDIVATQDRVYVAMAGLNQICELDLARQRLQPIAGSGRLGLVDGPGSSAAFAQPAGLALVQHTLYVADAQASAIRSVQLGTGNVHTLVGQGLYDFGAEDGTRSAARLQFPIGLALDPRSPQLWIADSYNDSIRSLRLGGGDLRRHPLEYRLHDPVAIAASPGALWVTSSSAHEIMRIDLDANIARRLPVGE